MTSETPLSENVQKAIRAGHKIEAIKRLRAETGLGLKDAKHIIDAAMADFRAANPELAKPQGAGVGTALIVLGLIAAAAYFFLVAR